MPSSFSLRSRPAMRQPLQNLVEQPERVPIQARGQPHRRVRETVQFFENQFAAGECAEHGAAAFGAEIEGQIVFHDAISMMILPTPSA